LNVEIEESNLIWDALILEVALHDLFKVHQVDRIIKLRLTLNDPSQQLHIPLELVLPSILIRNLGYVVEAIQEALVLDF